MKKLLLPCLILLSVAVRSQQSDRPFIRLAAPTRESVTVQSPVQYISGATCKNCNLTVNGQSVTVYATGGFAYELALQPGENQFNLIASGPGNATVNKQLTYRLIKTVVDTVKTLDIARIEVLPAGDLVVKPGDKLQFKVKAMPGGAMTANGNIPLYEQPTGPLNPTPGIYQGEYIIQASDSFAVTKMLFTLTDSQGKFTSRRADSKVSMLNQLYPDMVVTKGRLAHLLFGLGDDRLGGAKIGYIDSLIPLHVIGKVGGLYELQLSKYRTAWIPDEFVEFLPKGTFSPSSLTGSWRVFGDSAYDYVRIGLSSRLPYQSSQLLDPSKIVIDIFGATNNTNWLTQLENTEEISNVYYEQVEDEVLRVTIQLKHRQHWGHLIYYTGNSLVIKVRRQPADLSLKGLTIAIDPGHGGGNAGTYGPTGSSEKEIALSVSLKLRQALRLQGAKVIMTRTMEKFVDNKDRILLYRDSLPDLLVSIHLNSSDDPVHIGGASTYYKHIGFRDLSRDIYKRMLELGLKEFGNIGSFNFMLNSPIEYPNALVEMAFLSNPEDEMKIVDDKFQQDMADKIVLGIKDFLERARQDR